MTFSLKSALAAIKKRNEENPSEVLVGHRIDPDSPQERMARAQRYEADLNEQMEWLSSRPDSDLKTMRMNAMFDRLGELAAEQGDYDRAVTLSKSPERRKHYQDIVKAIKREDSKSCKCEDEVIVDRKNQVEFTSPAMMTVDTIIGPGGQPLNLDVCRFCGFSNAR